VSTETVLPGGYGRSTLAVGPSSPIAVRGEGYRLWDDRGAELIDANNNFTTLIHGHAEPTVTEQASRALAAGASFGLPHASEVDHARRLVERSPGLDQVRYANSGSEAVMTAVRVARAHTGRDLIVVTDGAYHGLADAVLPSGGPRSLHGLGAGGLGDTLVLPIADPEALAAALDEHGPRIAAVLLDLLPNRAGLVPVSDEVVAAVERARARFGTLLIVDEVVSFRLGWSGLAAARGVRPDLVTVGKLIGGGLPVGAIVGRAEVMAALDPFNAHGIEHGGTMTANPVTMAAGIAALDRFDAAAVDRLNALGDTLRTALADAVQRDGWTVRGTGSLVRPFPSPGAPAKQQQLALWWAAYERGVLMTPNALLALSTPMDEAVIGRLTDRVADAVHAVATA